MSIGLKSSFEKHARFEDQIAVNAIVGFDSYPVPGDGTAKHFCGHPSLFGR
jgi:hypothetical protein